jgi:adenylate cyclase
MYAGALGALFLTGYYYFDRYYWFAKGIWSYIGMPFIEITALFILITLYKYITEEKERKKVKGAFAHYLSPEVITQVLDNPEQLQLGGVRKELTVFFSDVRGFTTISESLTPEQLCTFMNAYFTPMTDIILKSQGVLDKYIGDAIMAFWGAPIALPQQADIAAEASLNMLYALDKVQADFKAKGFPNIDMGIGLNTGPMSVGNMGSDERFCYTVMGDSVNLGARLEGLTKEYGIKIMISEFTVARLIQKHHLLRDLDDIRVKGKNEPIKVFHLIRPDLLPQERLIHTLIETFQAARALYRQQRWEEALTLFQECLHIHPKDGPSLLYCERIQDYRQRPFIEAWDGVYTFKHK